MFDISATGQPVYKEEGEDRITIAASLSLLLIVLTVVGTALWLLRLWSFAVIALVAITPFVLTLIIRIARFSIWVVVAVALAALIVLYSMSAFTRNSHVVEAAQDQGPVFSGHKGSQETGESFRRARATYTHDDRRMRRILKRY